MKTRHLLSICLLVLLVVALLATPVYAQTIESIYAPDVSDPSILGIDVFQNYLSMGDQLWVVNYNLGYSTALRPTDPVSSTYLGVITNVAGTTILGSTNPYPFFDAGYGSGLFSVYFPSDGPTWEGAYAAGIRGSPTGYNWLVQASNTAIGDCQYFDGTTYTTLTTEANNATANDVTLPYAAVNRATYWGSSTPFTRLLINQGTAGVGSWIITWEYWNGTWLPLSGVADGTSDFMAAAGNHFVSFSLPTDWTTTTVGDTATPYYYVRARVSAFVSQSAAPLGTQMWTNNNNNPPSVPSTSITWHTTTSQAATSLIITGMVLQWADTLSAAWNVALTTTGATGTILSTLGVQYFTNAIPGLASTAPNLFSSALTAPIMDQTYQPPDPTVAAVLEDESPIDTTGISNWLLGGHNTAFKALLFAGFYALLVGILGTATRRMDYAFFCMLPILPIGAALGGINIIIIIVITFLVALAAAFTIIVQRGAA